MSAAEIAVAIAILAITLVAGIAIGRAVKSSPTEPDSRAVSEPLPHSTGEPRPEPGNQVGGPPALDSRLLTLLEALPGIVIVVDARGVVVLASDEATRERLVRRDSVTNDEIASTAAASLARNERIVLEVTVMRPPLRRGRLDLRVNAIPIGVTADPDGGNNIPDEGQVAVLLLENLTVEARARVARRDFTANVSHELKTPVGAMSLLAEALVAASDDQELVEHFAKRLQAEAKRLTSLINDVINLSRIQGDDPMPNPRPVDVQALVNQSVGSLASAGAAKNIDILISSRNHAIVVGDSDQLLIALTNLLSNAIAYSEPGTHIAIVVREDAGLVEIDVKDQGIGIPEEEHEHIFERFYRVDEARSRFTGGTGLGLAIVRNVCRNHGGEVNVWSVEGEGSTFTMKLPTAESEALAELTDSDAAVIGPTELMAVADPSSAGSGPVFDTSGRGRELRSRDKDTSRHIALDQVDELGQDEGRVETPPISETERAEWTMTREERR